MTTVDEMSAVSDDYLRNLETYDEAVTAVIDVNESELRWVNAEKMRFIGLMPVALDESEAMQDTRERGTRLALAYENEAYPLGESGLQRMAQTMGLATQIFSELDISTKARVLESFFTDPKYAHKSYQLQMAHGKVRGFRTELYVDVDRVKILEKLQESLRAISNDASVTLERCFQDGVEEHRSTLLRFELPGVRTEPEQNVQACVLRFEYVTSAGGFSSEQVHVSAKISQIFVPVMSKAIIHRGDPNRSLDELREQLEGGLAKSYQDLLTKLEQLKRISVAYPSTTLEKALIKAKVPKYYQQLIKVRLEAMLEPQRDLGLGDEISAFVLFDALSAMVEAVDASTCMRVDAKRPLYDRVVEMIPILLRCKAYDNGMDAKEEKGKYGSSIVSAPAP